MNKQFLKDAIGWGIGLWFIGYVFGILLFAFVLVGLIGWIISPIGILITLWVLLKKIKNNDLRYYVWLGIIWAVIAIIFDYLFLVKLLKPTDGYYKIDVYLYYLIMLILPIIIGLFKIKIKQNEQRV